ncbi:hypothetical protein BO71DRAFT_218725 [Aspergillus ellipticus CBS 707.79]|uniref:RING-type domain-containing protein n=1 Tax=Aspergillus ellipticus CBS 707.79 TaxID=1448320 RepID=A0A319DC19_9EURO|nr:hypothetical protein BO71DRAFT_218725 [Aspergillus ellipticus CBS 707.79]
MNNHDPNQNPGTEPEPEPEPDPNLPPLPDRTLQLQILLILCLSVYIITAIVLLLKSYCVAYGPFDFAVPSPAPSRSRSRTRNRSPSSAPGLGPASDDQIYPGAGAEEAGRYQPQSQGLSSSEARLKVLNRVAPVRAYGVWVRSVGGGGGVSERSSLLDRSGGDGGRGGDYGGEMVCAICLDPVNHQEMIHALPCRHVFHGRCLESWFLEYHNSCPVCWRVFLV